MAFFVTLLLYILRMADYTRSWIIPDWVTLTVLAAAPLLRWLRLRVDRESRSIVLSLQPPKGAMAFPQGRAAGMALWYGVFALVVAGYLLLVPGGPEPLRQLVLSDGNVWIPVLLLAGYCAATRGRACLPADILFTGLIVTLCKVYETGATTNMDAFFFALRRNILLWQGAAVSCALAVALLWLLWSRRRRAGTAKTCP